MENILFISPHSDDYLSACLLHGLRGLFSCHVVDFPKYESMYRNNNIDFNRVHGKGFTIFGLLDDIRIDRSNIAYKVESEYFKLIIFSSIWRNFGFFIELLPFLNYNNTVIIDGEDTPQPYPFAGKWWRYPPWRFLPVAHTKFLYFKREWTDETVRNIYFKLIPSSLCGYLPNPKNFRTISFSVPEEKIVKKPSMKTKIFPKHIIDPEITARVPESTTDYAFMNEYEYYTDLQDSKFGITCKRAGWDSMRNYEIAANGCVPCFRDLDKKPATCAPHGLNASNCIVYHNHDDLMMQIKNLKEKDYNQLQQNALTWVKQNSTIASAKQLLKNFNFSKDFVT